MLIILIVLLRLSLNWQSTKFPINFDVDVFAVHGFKIHLLSIHKLGRDNIVCFPFYEKNLLCNTPCYGLVYLCKFPKIQSLCLWKTLWSQHSKLNQVWKLARLLTMNISTKVQVPHKWGPSKISRTSSL